MDVKLLLTLAGWIGIPGTIAAYFFNLGTWKSDFIFFFFMAWAALRFVSYAARVYVRWRNDILDIRIKRKQLKDDK